MTTNHENYWCLSCQSVTVLNEHFKCSNCNSDSVIRQDVITNNPSVQQILNASKAASEAVIKSFAPKVPKLFPFKTLYRVTYGPFYTTLFASSEEEARRIADTNIEITWQLTEGQHVNGYFDFTDMYVEAVDRTKRVLVEEKA